jgi:peptidoglycan hydrolase CwlO-like protein
MYTPKKMEHSPMSLSRRAFQSTLFVFAFALITTTSACVTKGTYDKKVAELETLRADHDRAAADREKTLMEQIDRLRTQASEADKQINALSAELAELRKKIDESTALAEAVDW